MTTRPATEKQISNVNVIFTNVISNVADPEYINVDGLTLAGSDIPAGVAVVTMAQYDKIADVIGLATAPRFCVGLGTVDDDIRAIDVFDIEDEYRIIATRFFKIEGVQ